MTKEVKDVAVETTQATPSDVKAMKRGTIIQAVKAIAVLVCICLVCGALLALCNDIFYISDAERERRAEAKINAALKEVYPDLENPVTMKINKEYGVNSAYGSIQKVVKSSDGAYVIAAEGIGGYGGSIVVLVAINKDAEIVGWKVSDGGGETFLDDVTKNKNWYVGEKISTEITLLRQGGATYTSTALNNAIKMASYYAMNVLNLGSNPEKDARDALAAVLADTAYADYTFTTSLDSAYVAACAVPAANATLSYYFTGAKEGAEDIAAYAFIVGEEVKIVVARDNVTHAERLEGIIATSEDIDEAIVNSVKNRSYLEYTLQTIYADFTYAGGELDAANAVNGSAGEVTKVYESGDGATILQVIGKQGYSNGTITLNVAIKDDKIVGWSIVSNEKQSFIGNILNKWDTYKNWFIGDSIDKTQSIVTPDAGEGKGSGATYTENAISNAINTACKYIQNTTEQGGGE